MQESHGVDAERSRRRGAGQEGVQGGRRAQGGARFLTVLAVALRRTRSGSRSEEADSSLVLGTLNSTRS